MFAAGSGEQQFWGSIECEMGLKPVIEVNWRREACARCVHGACARAQGSRLDVRGGAPARSHVCVRARAPSNDFIIFRQMHIGGEGVSGVEGANITFLSHVQVWKYGSRVPFFFPLLVVLFCLRHYFICCHAASHHIHFGGGAPLGLPKGVTQHCVP